MIKEKNKKYHQGQLEDNKALTSARREGVILKNIKLQLEKDDIFLANPPSL